MKNKKAVSGVITTVLLIALSLVAIGVVWGVVNSLISEKTDNVEACIGNFDKVELNGRYICYNTSAEELQVSINIGDIKSVNKVIIYVEGDGSTSSFELTDTDTAYTNVKNYPAGSYGDANVKLPGKNSGKTYVVNTTALLGSGISPDSIKILPFIGGQECQASDVVNEIISCDLLA